uniref:Uncharacterized protein n=1 Tax=Glossina palpalis gambiensis TaxID=67801 RepID=A0A1B0BG43_9MUSC
MCNKFKLSGNSSRASSTTVRASRGRREPVKSKANKCRLGACSVRRDKANRARCKAVSNIVPMRLFNSRGVAGALELIVKLLKDCCTLVLMVKVEPPVLLVVAEINSNSGMLFRETSEGPVDEISFVQWQRCTKKNYPKSVDWFGPIDSWGGVGTGVKSDWNIVPIF